MDGPATPLLALDVVAIDSETTGLDPRRARLVSFAGVSRGGTLDLLVDPGEPIPPEATRVHGIDDARVAGAPRFPEAWPIIAGALAGRVVVGHTIGFDLAVLAAECARAGLSFEPPRVLDVRLLAEVAAPDLAGYGLDQLAAWLGVEVVGRHTAVGDAQAAMAVFGALLPRLRERGVRTLGEAEAACRGLTGVLDAQHRAGYVLPVREGAEVPVVLARIDSWPYRHRASDLATSFPRLATTATLGDAIAMLALQGTSAVIVADEERPPAARAGLLTERDVVTALAAAGAGALARPAGEIAKRPLLTVSADDLLHRAIARMDRLGIRHLAVTDPEGRVTGGLRARDLLAVRAATALALGDALETAGDVPDLAAAWGRLPAVAGGLLAEDVSPLGIAEVISQELRDLTRRAADLALGRLASRGLGGPPAAWALLVLGSAGRGESLLAMDQDNALVFAEGAPGDAADRWFAAFGEEIATILDQVGVPLCKGGVMARTPEWRGSLGTWRDRVSHWVGRANPRDLLSVDIFFDARVVAGDATLADVLRAEALALASASAGFAKLLADATPTPAPAFGLFGRLKLEDGRIDLKRAGLFGVVGMARVLAVRHGIAARETRSRLEALEGLGIGGKADLDALVSAHEALVGAILRQQVADIAAGRPPSNRVDPRILEPSVRAAMEAGLKQVAGSGALMRDLLFA